MRVVPVVKSACVIVAFSLLLTSAAAGRTMKESVNKAVLEHPDVQASWHAFMASQAEQAAAGGGYQPRIDLVASVGRESLGGAGYAGRDQHDYFRSGAYLTLSQMIYDGGLTQS